MTVNRLAQDKVYSNYKLKEEKLKSPIFVIGCGRSGSTLLLNLLGQHKNIYSIEKETALFTKYKSLIFPQMDNFEKTDDLKNLTLSMLAQMFYSAEPTKIFIQENKYPTKIIDLRSKIEAFVISFSVVKTKYDIFNLCVSFLTIEENKKRWVEKTPNNIHNTDFILSLYPNAEFVEIYRDPRAVCLSWINTGYSFFKSSNIIECIFTWNLAVKKGEELIKKMPRKYYRLKYEDLISNPEYELKKVCDFIEETFDPKMLDVTTVETFFPDTKNETGFSKTPLDRWKKMLSTNELIFIDLLTKKQRKRLGYPDSNAKLALFNLIPFSFFVLKKCIEARKHIKQYIKWQGFAMYKKIGIKLTLLYRFIIFRKHIEC